MERVCSNCGEQNAPGAQFCFSCRAYLGWQDGPPTGGPPPPGPPPPGPPGPPPGPPTDGPTPTVAIPKIRPQDVAEPAPFEAAVDGAGATVPIDGTPVSLSIDVTNTSTVVDSYVVEVVEGPPWLEFRSDRTELLPSGSGRVGAQLRIVSATLVPAQDLAVRLRVRNTTGSSRHRDMWLKVTVPVMDGPIGVRAEPQVVRARDVPSAVCTVVIDNSRSNRWSDVRLSAKDPEQVVRFAWDSTELQVPPGGEARARVRLEGPSPEPGAEVSRSITITASEGARSAFTTVTFTQTTSDSPMEQLALQLDPSVLRLGGGRRGQMTVLVDNRRGAGAAQVSLRGNDPENSLTFSISPPTLQVPAGQTAHAVVRVTARAAEPGAEVTRPLTISASDGRREIHAQGSVVQLAPSRRGLARILLTLLGALLMVVGATAAFASGTGEDAFDLDVPRVGDILSSEFSVPRPGVLDLGDGVSVGVLFIVLAALAAFGLTDTSGKLTRVAALFGAALTVATVVGSSVSFGSSDLQTGAVVTFIGCVVAYVGGLLARR